jgi:hypothetical protein
MKFIQKAILKIQKKNSSLKVSYKRCIENKNLSRLDNGFVVFNENIFINFININKKNEINLK